MAEQLRCPHCGGLHFGERFDNCPYEKLLNDPESTLEQRENAKAILRSFAIEKQEHV